MKRGSRGDADDGKIKEAKWKRTEEQEMEYGDGRSEKKEGENIARTRGWLTI